MLEVVRGSCTAARLSLSPCLPPLLPDSLQRAQNALLELVQGRQGVDAAALQRMFEQVGRRPAGAVLVWEASLGWVPPLLQPSCSLAALPLRTSNRAGADEGGQLRIDSCSHLTEAPFQSKLGSLFPTTKQAPDPEAVEEEPEAEEEGDAGAAGGSPAPRAAGGERGSSEESETDALAGF